MEEQNGFRAGMSGVDIIFCLIQIIEKLMKGDLESHLSFIDLQKSYYRVPGSKLW